jgi:hypothetical protein
LCFHFHRIFTKHKNEHQQTEPTKAGSMVVLEHWASNPNPQAAKVEKSAVLPLIMAINPQQLFPGHRWRGFRAIG